MIILLKKLNNMHNMSEICEELTEGETNVWDIKDEILCKSAEIEFDCELMTDAGKITKLEWIIKMKKKSLRNSDIDPIIYW